jgi:hypothetical protein
MLQPIQQLTSFFGNLWCNFWHSQVTWPVNGMYTCKTCLRTYPVQWANRLPEDSGEQPKPNRRLVRSVA